jgi:hypothetical protein
LVRRRIASSISLREVACEADSAMARGILSQLNRQKTI